MAHHTDRNTDPQSAVGYVRVSTEEQAREGVSLSAQQERIRAYCTMRGLDLVAVVTDSGVSAGKPLHTRPGGQQVLDMVSRGEVANVVAMKLDRLFRDCADCLEVTRDWDRRGLALHLIDLGGQAIDTSTAMGRFFLTVMAGAAEMERNLVRERTAAAMAYKKARGEYTGGEAPYGWHLTDDNTLEPHRAEQQVIAAARELRAAGLSLRKVGAGLAERGLLPRSRRQWHAETVKALLGARVAA
jgi:site-specific DNA recombinase